MKNKMIFVAVTALFVFCSNNNIALAKDKNVIHYDTVKKTEGVIARTKALDVSFEKGYTEICSIVGDKELHCVRIAAAKK